MLRIDLDGAEYWNEESQEFVQSEARTLTLEHSLVTVSKWEQKHHKSFLGSELTPDETQDYIRFMVQEDIDDLTLSRLVNGHVNEITDYIYDKATASTVNSPEHGSSAGEKIITSELIYYWMIELNIWLECEHWHLNRLLMLIRIVNHKRTPPKKRNPSQIARSYRALNARRRRELGTSG